MEKLVYLLRDPRPVEALRGDLLAGIDGVRGLEVLVADLGDAVGDHLLLLGEGRELSASVSGWLDSLDDRGPIETWLHSIAGRVDGYLVTESVPQRRTDRDWPDGERTPGVTHFSWFPRPDRIAPEEFYRAWHEDHTPFSFELHPRRCEYVRDSVARAVTPDAPPLAAIVAERFPTLEDYTDPDRLFGSPELLARSAREVARYADLETLSCLPMSQYIL